jgi:hypothetical protein
MPASTLMLSFNLMIKAYNRLADVYAGVYQLYVSVHTNIYQLKKVLNAAKIINYNFIGSQNFYYNFLNNDPYIKT